MLVFLFIFALQHKGTPKGAMMTNANMNSEMAAIQMQYEVCILELEQLLEYLLFYCVFCSENCFSFFVNFFLDLLLRESFN